MNDDPADLPESNLIVRTINLVRRPRSEWDRIAQEPTDNAGAVYRGHVAPLAILAAAAGAAGAVLFERAYWPVAAVGAVAHVIVALLGVFFAALIVNRLAPTFGAERNSGQAHKLAAYGATAALLAGVFAIYPMVAWLGVLGLYSLALIYLGLPRLMGASEEQRMPYFALSIVLAAIAFAILSALVQTARSAVTALPVFERPPSQAAAAPEPPRPGGLNLEQLERGAQFRVAVNPERLEGFLPASLPGGFTRRTLVSASTQTGAEARAAYASGASTLAIALHQLAGAGSVTAFVTGLNVRETGSTADGNVRTETLHGRLISEEIRASGAVRYIIVGRGVAMVAEGGGGTTIDEVRAALETIGIERVEQQFAN